MAEFFESVWGWLIIIGCVVFFKKFGWIVWFLKNRE